MIYIYFLIFNLLLDDELSCFFLYYFRVFITNLLETVSWVLLFLTTYGIAFMVK